MSARGRNKRGTTTARPTSSSRAYRSLTQLIQPTTPDRKDGHVLVLQARPIPFHGRPSQRVVSGDAALRDLHAPCRCQRLLRSSKRLPADHGKVPLGRLRQARNTLPIELFEPAAADERGGIITSEALCLQNPSLEASHSGIKMTVCIAATLPLSVED